MPNSAFADSVSALLFTIALLVALPAGAQRTDAVTAASDAFGNTVGFQTIGLHSPPNSRDFNPRGPRSCASRVFWHRRLTDGYTTWDVRVAR